MTTPTPRPTAQGTVRTEASKATKGIEDWQGAMNCMDSFVVKAADGVSSIQLSGNNCTVAPSEGKGGDNFTITVTNAGPYSLNATSQSAAGRQTTEVYTGYAGKADQQPLIIKGWGVERNYYQTFDIQVMGGTTGGTITFEADGCSVSPTTGTTTTLFTVTVTRVGEYNLKARMEGNGNYAPVYSVVMGGVANKSSQFPIEIAGWQEKCVYGDTFRVDISGGTTSEPLSINPVGCQISKVSGSEYEVAVNSVGAYSLTVSRAGNYGYTDVVSALGGVSHKADQPSLSMTGWSQNKNCNDSFPIHVTGGMPEGNVHFITVGCSVTPITGTVDTSFVVTVNTVGEYRLTACMDETAQYEAVRTHTQKGTAGKASQNKLVVDGWNANAATGDSFDIRLLGGGGTGRISVLTSGGCYAVLKDSEAETYTITVTADGGEGYSLMAAKAGDATYSGVSAETVRGKVAAMSAEALSVSGWREDSAQGDSFTIQIGGGVEDGTIEFETEGCTVCQAQGGSNTTFVVTVDAGEGDAYTLLVKYGSKGGSARTSTQRSGSVQRVGDHRQPNSQETAADPDPFEGAYGAEVWLLGGIILSIAALLVLILLLKRSRNGN